MWLRAGLARVATIARLALRILAHLGDGDAVVVGEEGHGHRPSLSALNGAPPAAGS